MSLSMLIAGTLGLLANGSVLANPAKNKQIINQIYDQLDQNAWNQLLSVSLTATSQPVVQDGRVKNDDNVVTCTSEQVKAGANDWVSEGSLLNPSTVSVWPGSLVYANRQLAEGTPTPIRLKRAPLTVRVNLPGLHEDAGTRTITKPTNVSVKNAVDDAAISWLEDEGETYAPPLRIYSQSEKAYSTQQIGIDLGFSAQWANSGASGSMKVNSSSSETVVLKMIKQVYYSAELEIDGGVESYFDSSVTLTNGDISLKKPPAVVTSVDYGRILIAQMRVSEALTDAQAEAAMNYAAGISSASANVSTKIKNTAEKAQYRILAIGGGAINGSGTDIFNGDFSNFSDAITDNYVFSKKSPAQPISYTVASLDGVLRKMNATTSYVKHECKEYPNKTVEVKSTGGYVSKFSVNYKVPKGPNGKLVAENWASGRKTSPYQSGKIYIPGDAKNISIVGENFTGLVWDKVRKPLDVRSDALTKAYNCFLIYGTTLRPKTKRCD